MHDAYIMWLFFWFEQFVSSNVQWFIMLKRKSTAGIPINTMEDTTVDSEGKHQAWDYSSKIDKLTYWRIFRTQNVRILYNIKNEVMKSLDLFLTFSTFALWSFEDFYKPFYIVCIKIRQIYESKLFSHSQHWITGQLL